MKNFTDYDLLMVYLNECEDKKLQQQILSSSSACKRLDKLEQDMNSIEQTISPASQDNAYGHQLWNKIAQQLPEPKQLRFYEKFIRQIFSVKLSYTGLAALFMACCTFYIIGLNHNSSVNDNNTISNQLLVQNIQYHLAQSDIFLTQVNNMPEQSQTPMMLNTARHLLSSNRLFKSAMLSNKTSDNPHIKQLLIELEQVLTELSNSSSRHTQQYLNNITHDKLLYKVKSINQQLQNNNTLI